MQWYREGKPFRRFKDFYDLCVMFEAGKVDLDKPLIILRKCMRYINFKVDPSIIDEEFIINNKQKWDVETKSYSYKGTII